MPRANLRFRINDDLPEGVRACLCLVELQQDVQLVDISLAGVALLVEKSAATTAAILQSIERRATLTFILEAPSLQAPIAIPLQPVHCQEVGGKVLMGGRLLPGPNQRRMLESTMERIFNRRGAVRGYAPLFAQPSAAVTVPGASAELAGRMRDLSLSGVGLVLAASAAAGVAVGSSCRVMLDLEDGEDPLKLSGIVRRKQEAADGETIVGIEFDEVSVERPANSRRICRWVTERQLEGRGGAGGSARAALG